MRRNAVGQLQKCLKPGQLATPIQRDVVPAFGTGDHRADRNHQDVAQAVLDLAAAAGIFDRVEILRQVLNRHALLPRRCEETSSNVSPG